MRSFSETPNKTVRFSAKFCLGRLMKLTAAPYPTKNDTLRGWWEKLSNDLAVTPVHISWLLNPGLYGKYLPKSGARQCGTLSNKITLSLRLFCTIFLHTTNLRRATTAMTQKNAKKFNHGGQADCPSSDMELMDPHNLTCGDPSKVLVEVVDENI